MQFLKDKEEDKEEEKEESEMEVVENSPGASDHENSEIDIDYA